MFGILAITIAMLIGDKQESLRDLLWGAGIVLLFV